MHQALHIERIQGADRRTEEDAVVIEEPLEIRLNGLPLAVTMRTPGQDEALAAGFVLTEGIISAPSELWDVTLCSDSEDPDRNNVATVFVPPELVAGIEAAGRQRYASSSCGLCGKAAIEEVFRIASPIQRPMSIRCDVIRSLPNRLRLEQSTFERTGGLHAAGLFDAECEPLFVAEDVGRHNTVDKVIGQALLSGCWPLDDTVLMVSGRAGFEIVQKALVARIPAVCSVSAPSSLAVDLARNSGMILIGFLRGDRFNVYSSGEAIR